MRLAIGIEYDGCHYSGWQTQPRVNTIQDEVERAISEIADRPISVVCAGRTDAGVHAVCQVCHFDTSAQRPPDRWRRGINACLPADIKVFDVREVDQEFHARFSALKRSYRYVILNRRFPSALLHQRVHLEPRTLDHQSMHDAAQSLVGEHDFSAFRAASCQAQSPTREVYRITVRRVSDYIVMDICANAFLQNMVRIVAGTLMRIGRGEETVAWAKLVLQKRDRKHLGVTAPACGLYLTSVHYPKRYAMQEILLPRHDVLPFLST